LYDYKNKGEAMVVGLKFDRETAPINGSAMKNGRSTTVLELVPV
jgi:hypothetical protein